MQRRVAILHSFICIKKHNESHESTVSENKGKVLKSIKVFRPILESLTPFLYILGTQYTTNAYYTIAIPSDALLSNHAVQNSCIEVDFIFMRALFTEFLAPGILLANTKKLKPTSLQELCAVVEGVNRSRLEDMAVI